MSKKHLHNQAAIPLAPTFNRPQLRPMIAEYDPKKKGVKTELSDLVMVKNSPDFRYKCQSENEIAQQAGSTVPLMEIPGRDVEADEDYNPFEHRKLAHPTSDLDTLIHLLKGSLGTGILAMPFAFSHSGLFFGLFATFFIGLVCTYCVHVLVKVAHELCRRTQVPSLGFAETAEAAFLAGPPRLHQFSRLAKALVNTFLVIDLLGCCCVYVSFVSKNLKHVCDYYMGEQDLKVYTAILLIPLILMNLIRNLKYLAPFSMIANLLVGTAMGITFFYIFQDLPSISERVNEEHTTLAELPIFFGTAIFALEGIGVVMPLENNMKTPTHFVGCPGVLNTGMFFVVSLYSATGFFGYLRYGIDTKSSISLNLPPADVLAQSVNIMIAVAIFLTYSLQFYVPMEIIWKNAQHRFGAKKNLAEYCIRIALIIGTVLVAIAVPNPGPFISLVGAVCLSTLGLMFPALLEIVTFWERPGMGRWNWRLWKNLGLITFGIIGFLSGSYVSIQDIVKGEEGAH